MAIVFQVRYPRGEVAYAVGWPNRTLLVDVVPAGPEGCYRDEVEVDFDAPQPHPVLRIVGGPRRPTIHVRVPGSEAEREAWMNRREDEGWDTLGSHEDDDIVWCVATADDLDPTMLAIDGATVLLR